MKLLILTQKIDINDPGLGFFHGWVREFSKRFESMVVICLEKGEQELPKNVKVLSLGKESDHSRWRYLIRFYRYIWEERKSYDSVFVHMNQEYLLLGGFIWLMLGKKAYMWRNHHAGSILTDLAAFFCTKVFCTSKFSYTAKYKKTILMPVGVNTDLFKRDLSIYRSPRSILFLGRISPVKRPDLLISALAELRKQNIAFSASIYGNSLPADRKYHESLKDSVRAAGLSDSVKLYAGMPNEKNVEIYNSHGIFVNLSSSGMYDKTIFEAMACGCLVLASNDNLVGQINGDHIFKQGDLGELVEKLKKLLSYSEEEKRLAAIDLESSAVEQSLERLGLRLQDIIK